jgi:hypothetical protein
MPELPAPIEREAIRDALLESLRREPPRQYQQLKANTARVLRERGLPTAGHSDFAQDAQLRTIDERRFRELLWSLINSGVLVQGLNSSNEQWPFLSVTELGEDYLKDNGPDVYDPDRYVEQLAAEHPVDEVESRFLYQAIAAFHADLPDAAAVMLGAAAEHLILVLSDAIATTDNAVAARIEKEASRSALSLLTYVGKYLEDRKGRLPRRLREELSTTFLGIASMIRIARNDAGHPALDRPVARDQALVLLRLFPGFRGWSHDLMSELRAREAAA